MTNTTSLTNEFTVVNAAIESLTAKGLETMKAIGNRETSFFDEGVAEDSGIWGSCLAQEMGHKSSGVINRLRDLGLFNTTPAGEDDDSDWWYLTSLGADVANFLAGNLSDDEDTCPKHVLAEELPAEAPSVTVKVGRIWTYVYAADGSLLAEVRTEASAAVVAALQA